MTDGQSDAANTLFSSRIIRRGSESIELTQKQIDAAVEWLVFLKEGKLESEKSNYLNFIQYILKDVLGFEQNDIEYESNGIEFSCTKYDKKLGIEAKGTKQSPFSPQHRARGEHSTPILQLWTYMGKNNFDYGICTNYDVFALVSRNHGLKYYEFSFKKINKNAEELDTVDIDEQKLREFIYIFSKRNLIGAPNHVKDLFDKTYAEEKYITNKFYMIFHETRLMLIEEFIRIKTKMKEDKITMLEGRIAELNMKLQSETTKDRINEKVTKNKIDSEIGINELKIRQIKNGINTDAVKNAQLLLNRMIFMFFVNDKNFLGQNEADKKGSIFDKIVVHLESAGDNTTLVFENICRYFEYFNGGDGHQGIPGFNGGLFREEFDKTLAFKDNEIKPYRNANNNENVLKSMSLNKKTKDAIYKIYPHANQIIKNFLVLDAFDFNTEISVDILGRIFEKSLTFIEKISGGSNEHGNIDDNQEYDTNERNQGGVYYTPEYVTSYICRNAIIPYLSKTNKNTIPELIGEYASDIDVLEKKLRQTKILDPACGSGAFLIKAVDVMLDIHKNIFTFKKGHGEFSANIKKRSHMILKEFVETQIIKEIITNNIYGVDKSENAIEIAKLAMFFKTASKIDKLPNLSEHNTLSMGDSLCNFDWNEKFGEIINEGGFDIIIGNPPYVRHERMEETKEMLMKSLVKLNIDKKSDLSIYFFYLSLNKLLKKGGRLGFISSDSWMNVEYGRQFKKYLLASSKIDKIVRTEYNVFGAMVNTVITLLTREPAVLMENRPCKFIFVDTDHILTQDERDLVVKPIPTNELDADASWNRLFFKSSYVPDADIMTKLGKICKLRSGVKTGDNEFFVIDKKKIDEFKLNVNSEFFVKIISKNNSKEFNMNCDTINIKPDSYFLRVNNMIDVSGVEGGRNIKNYVEYHEKKDVKLKRSKKQTKISDKPSIAQKVKAGKNWYALPAIMEPSPIILSRFADKNLTFYKNGAGYHIKNNMGYCTPNDLAMTEPLLAYLSSSYARLEQELKGHWSAGGALQFNMKDFDRFPVPNFEKIGKENCKLLAEKWNEYKTDNSSNQYKLDFAVFGIIFKDSVCELAKKAVGGGGQAYRRTDQRMY